MGNNDPVLWLQRNSYVTVSSFEHADAGSFSHHVATSFTFTLAQALWLTPMALAVPFSLAHDRLRLSDLPPSTRCRSDQP
jgi:hypothetical protein